MTNEALLKININAKMLKDILKIQNTAVDEQKIIFNHKDIELSGVDPSHVYMIRQKIPIEAIEEYKMVNGGKDKLELGIDIDKLLSVFSGNIKKTDNIKLEYDQDNDKLMTVFNNFTKNNALLNVDNMPDGPKVPNLELPAHVTINLKEFYNFLKQADTVSDHFCIKMTKDKLFLIAIGDVDKVKLEYDKEQIKGFYVGGKFYSDGEYLSLFSLDIVMEIVRWLKVHYETCTLYINNENPLKIECKNSTETSILIAPRMEENNDYSEYNDYCNDTSNKPEIEPEEPKNDVKPEVKEPEDQDKPEIKEPVEKEIEQDIKELEEDRITNPPKQKDDWEPVREEIEEEAVLESLKSSLKSDQDIEPEAIKETVEPDQDNQDIKATGDIITLKNGVRVRLFTKEELDQAAKQFKTQEKQRKKHRYFKILEYIKGKKTDQRVRNIGLYQDIDPTIIIDVLELYNYTWHQEKIGGC